jgi:hypothetical protein
MRRERNARVMTARIVPAVLALVVGLGATRCLEAQSGAPSDATGALPGTRVLLDAHNAYPYDGRFTDRIDRALATGAPLAIEQDLVWRPAEGGRPARSIVSHGQPFDGTEPSLRDYFFERIRPIVERAFAEGRRATWPVVTLNLDLKTNEPEHHAALWALLGDYETWLTTAPRTTEPSVASPLDVKPVLVLTGESDAQAVSFHDTVPVGQRLRLFGAMPIRPPAAPDATSAAATAAFWTALPTMSLPRATNYRRWWNAPWAVVEAGGQRQADDWTSEDETRLRALVRRAHEAGLWVRMWTINGHPPGDEQAQLWSAGYNVGSLEQARIRWRAAVAAGVDFVATDQYEAFARERDGR